MKSPRMTIMAVATFALIGSACAQSDAARDEHHPDNASAAQKPVPVPTRGMMDQSGSTTTPGAGPMMSGASPGNRATPGGMMSGANMMPMTGMMTNDSDGADHVKDRLQLVKSKLAITDAQSAQWNEFVAAASDNAKAMIKLRGQMMARGAPARTLPQRLAAEDKATEAHFKAMKKTTAALSHLYDALSSDQKKIADGMVLGPMGMPMGMM